MTKKCKTQLIVALHGYQICGRIEEGILHDAKSYRDGRGMSFNKDWGNQVWRRLKRKIILMTNQIIFFWSLTK
jgi:hypothetical protein